MRPAIADSSPSSASSREGPRLPPKERPTLLLVDDLPENLFALEQVLRRDDVDIVTAGSGPEALELLLTRDVALALIDVQMPEMDGFDLAALMRGVERTRHVPIIFVTAGSSDRQRIFRGYEAGAVDFLFKPIDVEILRSKVDVFITLERQRKALEASEAKFRSLYELGMIGVVYTCPNRDIVDANDAFLELVGYSRADLEEGLLSTLELVPPGFSGGGETALDQLDREGSYGPFHQELLHRSGHKVPVLAGGALVDHDGVAVSFVLDVTEQKESERMRELFVAILGHDLRNPLGSMLLGAQLALSRSDEQSIRRPLQRVLDGGARMVRMIDQLLDMTRIQNGGTIALSLDDANLCELLDQVLLGAAAPRGRFQVETLGDTTGRWDPDRLFQVLSNLIGNACDHGPPDHPIHLRVDGRSDDEVALHIRNAGPAIPESLRSVVFEPFRGTADRKRRSRGLGLGLYITRQFVLAHGGTISLESSDEAGTAFEVRLPRRS